MMFWLQFCLYGDVFDSYANNCVGLRNTYCPRNYSSSILVLNQLIFEREKRSPKRTLFKKLQPFVLYSKWIDLIMELEDINLYTYPDTNCNAATTTKPPPTTQPSTEPTVKTTPVAPFDDFVCPNGGNELFPRPGHCTQFYLCEDGFPVKTYIFVSYQSSTYFDIWRVWNYGFSCPQNCPHGSEFDPSKKQCVVGGHFDC